MKKMNLKILTLTFFLSASVFTQQANAFLLVLPSLTCPSCDPFADRNYVVPAGFISLYMTVAGGIYGLGVSVLGDETDSVVDSFVSQNIPRQEAKALSKLIGQAIATNPEGSLTMDQMKAVSPHATAEQIIGGIESVGQ